MTFTCGGSVGQGSSYQGGVSNINFLYPKRYNELFLCFSNNDVVDNVENILKGYSSASTDEKHGRPFCRGYG